MPECYTHSLIANRALIRSGQLVVSFPAFLAGANGPEPFFLYQLFKQKNIPDLAELSERIHHEKAGLFLNTLVHLSTTPIQQCYTLGFLTHYATDCIMSPYISYMAAQENLYKNISYAEKWLQTSIDSALYFSDYRTPLVPLHVATPVLITEELAQVTSLLHSAIKEVYNIDVPSVMLADTFHNLLQVRKMFISKYGVKKVLLKIIEPFLLGKENSGKATSHMQPGKKLPTLPINWVNPYTAKEKNNTMDEVVANATEASAICISGCMRFWLGKIDAEQLSVLLADNDYSTGLPCEGDKSSAALPTQQHYNETPKT